MKKPEPTVIIAGDFNFPFIEWTRNDMNICSYKMKSDSYGKTEEKNNICMKWWRLWIGLA